MTQTKPSVLDLSHWQTTINFATLKAGGILGVILKATEGTGYTDTTYRSRRASAEQAGLIVSTYHFLKAGNAQAQMAYYLAQVNPAPGERMVIDVEEAGTTLSDVHAAVQALLDDPRGVQVTVYGGSLIKDLLGSSPDKFLADNTSLWLAQYTSGTPSWPKQVWPNWSLWQYSDKGSVKGVSGACDVNVFNGEDANLVKWLSPAPKPVPQPPVTPDVGDLPTVTVHLDADKPVKLRIIVGPLVTVENQDGQDP